MENSCLLTPASFNMEGVNPRAKNQLGNICLFYEKEKPLPDLNSYDIAIIGVEEDRYSHNNSGSAYAPARVREYFYSLYAGPIRPRIADLGNVKQGHAVSDTQFAVQEIVSDLVENNKSVIVIGGSQDLTYGIYRAFAKLNQVINIVAIDRKIDIDLYDTSIQSESYLKEMISQQPNYLFNFSNIGYQTYFTDQDILKLMDNLYFDLYRLGIARKAIQETEAIIRNSDIITFDISAARASEAPGHAAATPNGFTGEEMCQLARYAGLSDKLSVAGFFEYNPAFDKEGITAHL
ncbi:MAG TPA: formimidoylglutamase, partial [Bacteroidales bacterium]|nr:formimidoylglutamase [Bacteroidales bacterium]